MAEQDNQRKPSEKDAVYTTIVGGRPPGSGTNVVNIPRGIEVLVKKASVDKEFRVILLAKRAEAAKEIDLELTEDEKAILQCIPNEQLEKIISETKVKPDNKALFLGSVGMLMLAVVAGVAITSSMCLTLGHTIERTHGIRPDRIEELKQESPGESNSQENDKITDPENPNTETITVIRRTRPDRPEIK